MFHPSGGPQVAQGLGCVSRRAHGAIRRLQSLLKVHLKETETDGEPPRERLWEGTSLVGRYDELGYQHGDRVGVKK